MIKKALENLRIAELNAMQQASIEAAGKGDVVLLSPTGSGKTLAFLLPVLSSLNPQIQNVQALILVPSRELALQIEQVFKAMSTGFKITCCYGGHSTKIEKNSLLQPPAVLVGTPGRIAYHQREETFATGSINTLVLDEFDKSLEFGFQSDMSAIIRSIPNIKKRILTSATQMDDIPDFTGVDHPGVVNFLHDNVNTPDIQIKKVISPAADKLDTLFKLICKIGGKPTLVFCNHREAVDRISDLLWYRGVVHDVFHGGMEQADRERALLKFRNGSHNLLITTDLASRGLDIPEIAYVVHYQLPHNEEAFIHRNGRTARMHAKGTAYLVTEENEKVKYLDGQPEIETLPNQSVLPPLSEWITLYIGAGKKDKINKVDIVGLLLQKGKLAKDELGRIEVMDHCSYAAIKRGRIDAVVEHTSGEKIKNKKVKIEISQ